MPILILSLLLSIATAQHGLHQPPECTEDLVSTLYSNTPYPPRDPNLEVPGVILFQKHEDPNLIRATIFGGKTLPIPFRTLIAGGGTGDATIALALGLAKINHESTILHVDLSKASLDVAKQRLRKHANFLRRSSVRILFLKASISNLPEKDLGGKFHYINCIGVLHHMPRPQEGLKILSHLLHENGGLNFMVYGSIGRTGVYHVRKMARIVHQQQHRDEAKGSTSYPTVGEAKMVLENLPTTNFFVRNALVQGSVDMQEFEDVGISDLILNPCDVAMSIEQVNEMATHAELRILAPVHPKEYEPTGSPALVDTVKQLPWIEQAAFAELQSGTIMFHHVWLVQHNNTVVPTETLPWGKHSIPCRADWMPSNIMPEEGIERGLMDPDARYEMEMGGETVALQSMSLPALGASIVSRMNCEATLEEIYVQIKEVARWEVHWEVFLSHAKEWRVSLAKGRAVHTLV